MFNAEAKNLLKRPKFSDIAKNYRGNKGPNALGKDDFSNRVGGKYKYNLDNNPAFENTCAARCSDALNRSGGKIPFIKGQVSSGSTGNWHVFRVKALVSYLGKSWGGPEHTLTGSKVSDFKTNFAGKQGLLIFDTQGAWSDATGHATFWDGTNTLDRSDYSNVSGKIMLWELR